MFLPLILLTFLYLAHGEQFYETHDFAEEEIPFEKEPTALFEYDRNGIITINGQFGGYFRLPGLPHEANNIGDSDVTWKFCVKTNSSCKNGIKVCMNHYPGEPHNCDYEVGFFSDGTGYRMDWKYTESGRRQSSIFKDSSVKCAEHILTIPHQAILAGGSVPNTGSRCDATLQIYGEEIPQCTWRWNADPECKIGSCVCNNNGTLHNRTIGLFRFPYGDGHSSYTSGEPGSVQGTHLWATRANGEFKPRFAGWPMAQRSNSDAPLIFINDTTTANGWSRQTGATFNDIVSSDHPGNQTASVNIKCGMPQRITILQKIWRCSVQHRGVYEVKSGLFKNWDMSLTNETYAENWRNYKQTLVFLKGSASSKTIELCVVLTMLLSFHLFFW